jgi:hypothetical protein
MKFFFGSLKEVGSAGVSRLERYHRVCSITTAILKNGISSAEWSATPSSWSSYDDVIAGREALPGPGATTMLHT